MVNFHLVEDYNITHDSTLFSSESRSFIVLLKCHMDINLDVVFYILKILLNDYISTDTDIKTVLNMRLCCKEWKNEVDSCTTYVLLHQINISNIYMKKFIKVEAHNPCLRFFWFMAYSIFYRYRALSCTIKDWDAILSRRKMHMRGVPRVNKNIPRFDRDSILEFILTEKYLPAPMFQKTSYSCLVHFFICDKKRIECSKCTENVW